MNVNVFTRAVRLLARFRRRATPPASAYGPPPTYGPGPDDSWLPRPDETFRL